MARAKKTVALNGLVKFLKCQFKKRLPRSLALQSRRKDNVAYSLSIRYYKGKVKEMLNGQNYF